MLRDQQFMQLALTQSLINLGQTWPNPCVGCVIVRGNDIVGRGVTARGGRPHAETIALAQAGAAARGATAYVTLEPCAHHGKTPPCADALILAGIKRVVIAIIDPDPRVAGNGIERLRQSGIEVVAGIGAAQAHEIHAGFFKSVEIGMPLVALKLATTRNGFLDTQSIGRRWITSQSARDHTHFLRAQYDAIMVGIGTILADDPMLNVRLPGYEHRSPMRVILDSKLRLPLNGRIAETAKSQKTIIVTCSADMDSAAKLQDLGIMVLRVPQMNMAEILKKLFAEIGITRVFIEGGFHVAQSVVRHNLADQIYWYRSDVCAPPNAQYNVRDLGFEPQPYFLDYALDSVKTFLCDELRIYKNAIK